MFSARLIKYFQFVSKHNKTILSPCVKNVSIKEWKRYEKETLWKSISSLVTASFVNERSEKGAQSRFHWCCSDTPYRRYGIVSTKLPRNSPCRFYNENRSLRANNYCEIIDIEESPTRALARPQKSSLSRKKSQRDLGRDHNKRSSINAFSSKSTPTSRTNASSNDFIYYY